MTAIPRPRAPRFIDPAKAPRTVPPPFTGPWAATDRGLDSVDLFPLPSGHGPEDVCVDLAGRVVAGGEDGNIWRWMADAAPGDPPQLLANTGGRPLGIEVDKRDGSLIVCDAYRGLLRIAEDGEITDLASSAAGTPIVFCNNAAVANDGTIFFTDSSSKFNISAWKRDILEHRPNGRLLSYRDGVVEVIATGFYFPNGVALTPDESALMLVEDSTHRLLKVPLATGAPEELIDLPAYPDNMCDVGDGTYWIALPSPRLPIVERLLPFPALRKLANLLPDRLQPQPKRYSLVALVDGEGNVLRSIHGPAGRYCMVTGVRQQGEFLWLGSLNEEAVARISLAKETPA
ncbi:MAG TPA: strictosidine synthase [Micromonosporaceae bacterium]|nr:strictosidine synthase [Micromonosporaceae bacterium]